MQRLSIVETFEIFLVIQSIFEVDVKVISDWFKNLRVRFVNFANIR